MIESKSNTVLFLNQAVFTLKILVNTRYLGVDVEKMDIIRDQALFMNIKVVMFTVVLFVTLLIEIKLVYIVKHQIKCIKKLWKRIKLL
jgi:hypothetical protein